MFMKKLIGTMLCMLTFLALLVSLAVPALAAPANAPVWEEGTKWAYGTESDIGAEFADELEGLSTMLEGETGGTVNELSIDGEVGMWLLFEVSDVTSTEYVLSATMAGRVSLDATISVTADMDKAGTYAWDEEPEQEEMTVFVDASVDAALVIEVETTFDKSTMAIKSIDLSVKINAALDFEAENIPNSDWDWDNFTQTVWYDDYDISAELEMSLDMLLEFDPALNLWDFPLDEGDQWTVSSTATLSGSMSGLLDVRGLPEDMEDELFNEEFVEETGITGFPIRFEELNADDSPFNNGEIEETSEEIELELRCTDVFTEDDAFWGDITVYEINVVDTPMMFYYSPQVGFMAYMSMDAGDLLEELDMPAVMDQAMMMEPVDPEVAEEKISDISDFQGNVGEDGGLMGFFTDPPYLGIILVAVIAIVVVAAVVLIRKK